MSELSFFKNIKDKIFTTYEKCERASVLNGRYTLGRKIAQGGLSDVYDASDIYTEYFEDHRDIVIKIPSQELVLKKDIAAFVYAEYAILTRLSHPNIVKVLNYGIEEETQVPYLVLEKMEGELLSLKSIHLMSKEAKKKIAHSIFSAISYLQEMNIVHADINPTNIMLMPDGEAKLFDFGISINNMTDKHLGLAYHKMNAYNPIYTAPEVMEQSEPNMKSDIFSLACVLYELYVSQLPFKTSSLELKDKAITLRDLKDVPLLQKIWLKKALSFEPSARIEQLPLCLRVLYFIKKLR